MAEVSGDSGAVPPDVLLKYYFMLQQQLHSSTPKGLPCSSLSSTLTLRIHTAISRLVSHPPSTGKLNYKDDVIEILRNSSFTLFLQG